jgi:hypothetical protein
MIENQYEKDLIINHRELKYKGIFKPDQLYAVINNAIQEKGYTKREKKSEELVTPQGRKVYVELRPYKELTRYFVLMIKIMIHLDNITDTTYTNKEGHVMNMKQGDVTVYFDAWTMTDYEQRWGMKPFWFFVKGFINKFIWPLPMEAGFIGELGSDTAYIFAEIKKHLNSHTERIVERVKEVDIIEQMKKEILEKKEEGESSA